MGTKFRTMLAPINRSTGDGRRFATGSITLATTPFPFEWVRKRQGGHDGAVSIGVVKEAALATVGTALSKGWVSEDAVRRMGLNHSDEAVWAQGEMFDDADRDTMPELAEDVATAMHLAANGTLGPSVDPDSFEGMPVIAGTDTPVTWDMIEEAELRGEELKLELLITSARIRAATLVSIPAFMETSAPLELIDQEPAADAEPVEALVASIAAPPAWRPKATDFEPPDLDGPTPFTVDWERGLVYGHVAAWGTCHVGYSGVCIEPPADPSEDKSYPWFNRIPVETEDGGIVWAGRLTVGGTHPDLSLTASQTMAFYDGKNLAAYMVLRDDPHGVLAVGPINPELTEADRAILSREKVSGDWRETAMGMTMMEVLALPPGPRSVSEPGFPVTRVHRGRQTALTAALGPVSARPAAVPDFSAQIRDVLREEAARAKEAAELSRIIEEDQAARAQRERAELAALISGGEG